MRVDSQIWSTRYNRTLGRNLRQAGLAGPLIDVKESQVALKSRMLWLLVAYAVGIRLLPYVLRGLNWLPNTESFVNFPWHLSPVTATCLFAGAAAGRRWSTAFVPLGVLLAGDLGILALTGRLDWVIYPGCGMVYAELLAVTALGTCLRSPCAQSPRWSSIASMVVLGCAIEAVYFVLSNTVAWYTIEVPVGTRLYPFTTAGWLSALAAGVPFFKMNLLGTAIYAGVLFSPLARSAALTLDPELLGATQDTPVTAAPGNLQPVAVGQSSPVNPR